MAADLQATASGWNNFFKPTETAIFKINCLVAQFYFFLFYFDYPTSTHAQITMGIYAFCAFFMSDLWTQSVQWWVGFVDSGQTIRTYPPNFIHNVLMEPIGYVRNVCSHNLPYASPRMICIPAIWMNISHKISLNITCLTTFAKFVFFPHKTCSPYFFFPCILWKVIKKVHHM